MGCIFSDGLLTGNNLLSQIRFAEKCPLCELKDVFVTERYIACQVIPNGCEESLSYFAAYPYGFHIMLLILTYR